MEIKFYYTDSDRMQLDKTASLLNERVYYFKLKRDDDIQKPILLFKLDKGLADVYNYCYITTLDRYYYIVNKRIISNKLIELQLETDVLMTYKEDILKSIGIVTKYNELDYSDTSIDVDIRKNKIVYYSDSIEYKDNIILNTIGGV